MILLTHGDRKSRVNRFFVHLSVDDKFSMVMTKSKQFQHVSSYLFAKLWTKQRNRCTNIILKIIHFKIGASSSTITDNFIRLKEFSDIVKGYLSAVQFSEVKDNLKIVSISLKLLDNSSCIVRTKSAVTYSRWKAHSIVCELCYIIPNLMMK